MLGTRSRFSSTSGEGVHPTNTDDAHLSPLFPLSEKKYKAEGSPSAPSRNAFTLCRTPSLLPKDLMFWAATFGNECAT